jgi:hypothetical protein
MLSIVATLLLTPQAAMAESSDAKVVAPKPLLNQPIPEKLTQEEVKSLMVKAGLKRNWIIKEEQADLMFAEIYVRSHYVAVDIKLHDGQYDISYRDSDNMKYNPASGYIHRKYKGWVKNLSGDIQTELGKAAIQK